MNFSFGEDGLTDIWTSRAASSQLKRRSLIKVPEVSVWVDWKINVCGSQGSDSSEFSVADWTVRIRQYFTQCM